MFEEMQSLVSVNPNAEDAEVKAAMRDSPAGSRQADHRNQGQSEIHLFTKHTSIRAPCLGGVWGTGDTQDVPPGLTVQQE